VVKSTVEKIGFPRKAEKINERECRLTLKFGRSPPQGANERRVFCSNLMKKYYENIVALLESLCYLLSKHLASELGCES